MKARINVKTIRGEFLTYNVEDWDDDGTWLKFFDEKTQQLKMFRSINCEITIDTIGNPFKHKKYDDYTNKIESSITKEEYEELSEEATKELEELRVSRNENKQKQ